MKEFIATTQTAHGEQAIRFRASYDGSRASFEALCAKARARLNEALGEGWSVGRLLSDSESHLGRFRRVG